MFAWWCVGGHILLSVPVEFVLLLSHLRDTHKSLLDSGWLAEMLDNPKNP